MSRCSEATMERYAHGNNAEDGVDVPLDLIKPDTLRRMVEEFVTREWSELADADFTVEEKMDHVMLQFKDNKIKVVFDLTSETCNIVPSL